MLFRPISGDLFEPPMIGYKASRVPAGSRELGGFGMDLVTMRPIAVLACADALDNSYPGRSLIIGLPRGVKKPVSVACE
ncbi:MAG: hypothetical protein QM831_25240 [Kofleriaceae bacterium]